MREGWFEREGARLHYLEWEADGDQRLPVLFLHGLSSNARFWERVAGRLSGRRMLALDQRSHGLSDRPPSGYTHDVLIADAAALLERSGVDRAVVAGHSWGAAIALELAAARRDRVAGLVFIDGPAASFSEVMTWDQAQQIMQPPLPRYSSLADAVLAKRRELDWESSWGDDLVPFVEAGLVQDASGFAVTLTPEVRFEILREMYHYHPELLWPEVEGPIELLLAESDTLIGRWKHRAEEKVRSLRPDADVRWLRSPHDIPIHLPDAVAAEVDRLSLRAAYRDVGREIASVVGDWSRPTGAEGWSAHDLLAHLSSTQAALEQVVRTAPPANGQTREPFDPDRWNAGQVRRRRELGEAELQDEVRLATERFEEALRAADLSRPTIGPFAGMPLSPALWELHKHQREHLAELRAVFAP
jgi:pimeloyl-ACP methyl ester carboxylesterase